MKAVYVERPGGPEALVHGERPDPVPGPGDVIVRVRATSVNFADQRLRSGVSPTSGLPRILGLDVVGEIAELGQDVRGFQVGERVAVSNRVKCQACRRCLVGQDEFCENQLRIGADLDGGCAEYCRVPAVNLERIPEGMEFEEAACFPLAGHTAWHCLTVRGGLRPWEVVLIGSVGSGVGSHALQFAKRLGARVIATAGSDWKLDKARSLGADEVINYATHPDFGARVRDLTGGRGVDLVIDSVGPSMLQENLLSLKAGGRLVITGTSSGDTGSLSLLDLQTRPLTITGSGGRSHRSFSEMMQFVRVNRLRGIVHRVFDLANLAEAHRQLAGRDLFGKLVVRVP